MSQFKAHGWTILFYTDFRLQWEDLKNRAIMAMAGERCASIQIIIQLPILDDLIYVQHKRGLLLGHLVLDLTFLRESARR
jgi:hypothetical protein